jgi:hypothetical protein
VYLFVVLVPALISLFRTRNNVIRVFTAIPKEVSGRIYRDLKHETKNEEKVLVVPTVVPTQLKIVIV